MCCSHLASRVNPVYLLINITIEPRESSEFCLQCRICEGSQQSADDWLEAALGQGGGTAGEMVLLQSSGSFFAFAPVLKALQNSHLPLAQFLAFPGTGFLSLLGRKYKCVSQHSIGKRCSDFAYVSDSYTSQKCNCASR